MIEARESTVDRPGGREGTDRVATKRASPYVATITVTRQSKDDVGFREIFVSVDGEQIGMLQYGESITHELAAGPHRVRAHNTLFWKRVTFHVEPGEHLEFMLINRGGRFTYPLVALLGVAPLYLTVLQRSVR